MKAKMDTWIGLGDMKFRRDSEGCQGGRCLDAIDGQTTPLRSSHLANMAHNQRQRRSIRPPDDEQRTPEPNRWMEARFKKGLMDIWMDECMDGYMDRQMDG